MHKIRTTLLFITIFASCSKTPQGDSDAGSQDDVTMDEPDSSTTGVDAGDMESEDMDAGTPSSENTLCSEDGWCWRSPLTVGNHLYDVAISPERNVISVGDRGTSLRSNGITVSGKLGPAAHNLRASWRNYSVGTKGLIGQWQNEELIVEQTPTETELTAIWGSSENDIWAIGPGVVLRKINGGEWQVTNTLFVGADCIWGDGPNNVWLGSFDGSLRYYDGQNWTIESVQTNQSVNAIESIFGMNGRVWVAVSHNNGRSELYYKNAEQKWVIDFAASWYHILSIHGDGQYAWAVGEQIAAYWDGTSWTERNDVPIGAKDVLVLGKDDVWVAGLYGLLAHYDGTTWTRFSGQEYEIWPPTISSISGTSDNDIWASGDRVQHYDGSTWTIEEHFPPMNSHYFGDILRVGNHVFTIQSDSGTGIRSLWAKADTEKWNVVNHGGGSAGGGLTAVWGTSPQDIWLVGEIDYGSNPNWTSSMAHFDGTTWQNFPYDEEGSFAASYTDIDGYGRSFVIAVGEHRRDAMANIYNGETWTSYTLGEIGRNERINRVSVRNESDAWMITSNHLFHYNGTGIEQVELPEELTALVSIKATESHLILSARTKIWGSVVAVFDGQSWKLSRTGSYWAVLNTWTSTSGRSLAVGENNMILEHENLLHK